MKQEEEKLLLIKCDKENKAKIEIYFEKNHPYDTPEMLWIAPDEVNTAYMARIKQSSASTVKNKK